MGLDDECGGSKADADKFKDGDASPANDPTEVGQVISTLESPSMEQELSFKLNINTGWKPRHDDLGWVRAGYLVAFAVLGYRYIIGPEFQALRSGFLLPPHGGRTGFFEDVADRAEAGELRDADFTSSLWGEWPKEPGCGVQSPA